MYQIKIYETTNEEEDKQKLTTYLGLKCLMSHHKLLTFLSYIFQLDSARIAASKMSPMMETINRVMVQIVQSSDMCLWFCEIYSSLVI